ncbi:MAG TPA: c-type cytochrome [Sediminibacterium sp.]|nr:c-type cytochrome [Sediminibacterium sp.]
MRFSRLYKPSSFSSSFKRLQLFLLASLAMIQLTQCSNGSSDNNPDVAITDTSCWVGPGLYQIPENKTGDSIRYGRALISQTAYYLGPRGTVRQITNGMNCQNCHLDAGTKPWGNNFGRVRANYPIYRARSGTVETLHKRITDCFERSLNGSAPDSGSYEMEAIVAYIRWVGQDVAKNTIPRGTGIQELPYMNRAADPVKGQWVYTSFCANCHGKNGEGVADAAKIGYQYPPLWGENSYNVSAGLYRLSRFAGFVKCNMPNTVNYHNPVITNEQAWDVAAFVNSRERPNKKWSTDWPDIRKKPVDHPFGPYADTLSKQQHKYGPWK